MLQKEENDAVDDQRDGDGDGAMQMRIKPVIKQYADNARGDDGENDVKPQR